MVTRNESPEPFFKFWERLHDNPSKRSVDQLWDFLKYTGLPLTKDGCFLAYKGVRDDLKDQHTGTIDNKPGRLIKMERNRISDDPREACHEGLHVGALSYAQGFSQRVVICQIAPENVVSVPYDETNQKMRVCEYKVLGHWNGQEMPSTVIYDGLIPLYGKKKPEKTAEEENDEQVWGDEGNGEETEKKAAKPEKKESKPKNKKAEKIERKAVKKQGKAVAKSWVAMDKMNVAQLIELSIDTLREYAFKRVKIVGASKIPGGKVALVHKILEARK